MNHTASEERQAIEDLLPWYANGRLSETERRAVEAALAGDDELRRRLELVREEMAATIAANEAIVPTSSRAFDRLIADIETTPQPARPLLRARAGLIDRLGGFLASLTPRHLAYASLAAAALVVVEFAALGGVVGLREAGGGFETASVVGGSAVADPGILVAFSPEARIDDLTVFLKRHGVKTVEEPKANGFFVLHLAPGGDTKAVATAMATETGIVGFAEATP